MWCHGVIKGLNMFDTNQWRQASSVRDWHRKEEHRLPLYRAIRRHQIPHQRSSEVVWPAFVLLQL